MMDKIILSEDEAAVYRELTTQVQEARKEVQVHEAFMKQSQANAIAHQKSQSAFIEMLRKRAEVSEFENFNVTSEDGKLVIIPKREPTPVSPSAS